MKGLFIPDITAEMFRNGCLESIEALMAEGEVYDIEYDPKSAQSYVPDANVCDPISRQAAIDALQGGIKLKDSDDIDNVAHYIQQVVRKINELPSGERKKGRWIKHEVKLFDGCHTGRYFEECSECGKLTPEWRLVTEYHYWIFCPKCGACNAREIT